MSDQPLKRQLTARRVRCTGTGDATRLMASFTVGGARRPGVSWGAHESDASSTAPFKRLCGVAAESARPARVCVRGLGRGIRRRGGGGAGGYIPEMFRIPSSVRVLAGGVPLCGRDG